MEARALHDFRGSEQDELPFRKNDILKVLRIDTEQMWFKAELHGREGLIPGNYIELQPNPWYHQDFTRQRAERSLESMRPGNFIVRNSETAPGEFSLSVRTQTGVQHYRIWHQGSDYYIWTDWKAKSLNELINHYKNQTVAKGDRLVLKEANNNSNARRVKAKYDYEGQEERDLPFRVGDTITVLEETDPNWWWGRLNGREGLFPVTYVDQL